MADRTELEAAFAEVGRLIEALPHHERRARVAKIVADMSESNRLDFLTGVFVVAHEMRGAAGLHQAADAGIALDHPRLSGVTLRSECGYVLFVPVDRMTTPKIVCPMCQEVLKDG